MKFAAILFSLLFSFGCAMNTVTEQSYQALEVVAQWKKEGIVNDEELQAIKDRLIEGASVTKIESLGTELRRIDELRKKNVINSDDTAELRGRAILKSLGPGRH